MKKIRVFLAHPANMPPKEIEGLVDPVRDSLATYYNEPRDRFKIITGRADHKRFFAQSGGWTGWQKSVVHRTDAVTGEYMYQLFVVCGDRCGKATASILRHALGVGSEVLHWSDSSVQTVIEVETEDGENWRDGFKVTSIELWDIDRNDNPLPDRILPKPTKPMSKGAKEAVAWFEDASSQTPLVGNPHAPTLDRDYSVEEGEPFDPDYGPEAVTARDARTQKSNLSPDEFAAKCREAGPPLDPRAPGGPFNPGFTSDNSVAASIYGSDPIWSDSVGNSIIMEGEGSDGT